MQAAFREPAKNDPDCEIRLGTASWDDGSGKARSVKYTWFDKNGKAARGGEFPVEALPQALEFAIRNGYLRERVLEVGSGSGYQAAVLALLAAHVYTIERDPELFRLAQERLTRLGLGGSITLLLGDGSQGYPPAAPYDAILVAAAAPQVSGCYLEQLLEGGRLVIPVGSLETQELRKIRKCEGKAVSRVLGHCRFVPLTGSQGWKSN